MSDSHQLFHKLGAGDGFAGTARAFETLDQGAELEREEPVLRTIATKDIQERLGPDQYGLRLTMDRQDDAGVGIFKAFEYFREVAV